VVACVADPNAVGRIVFADDGIRAAARPGFRYLETSTISPGLARRTAEVLRAKGADMLEAPVTGSKMGAEKGTLLLMTGGAREVHDELMPVMMAIGSRAIHCGEVGQASMVKLIGNTMISFMLDGLCEGLVAGRRAGIPLETILEVIQASGYSSPYYAFKGGAIARRDFDQHFSIDLLVKDQDLMLGEAAALKVPMPGLAAIREVFLSARARGLGQEDIAAVVKVVEAAAGEAPR
jgi:3-hydroxyisobutyrate dehydrogenase-like beta-hydroxyacid dehydrogenase